MFEIGEKVVCVNAAMQSHTVEELSQDVPNWVQEGKTYTIRGFADYDFVVAVYLEEIHNPPLFFSVLGKEAEPGFATWRFEKTQQQEETVEIEEVIYN